jgi:hypothetical protein
MEHNGRGKRAARSEGLTKSLGPVERTAGFGRCASSSKGANHVYSLAFFVSQSPI